MSDENRGFRVRAVGGVGSKIRATKRWGQPQLNKVGALDRGHCWSCSKRFEKYVGLSFNYKALYFFLQIL
jgi:hypothetical protein